MDQAKRKLTAILSADVKGYSRLIGEDEEGTIRTLKAHMEVIAGFIQQYRGRIVATGGDSVLAEFVSVVDAVRCAVEIQEDLGRKNSEFPETRRIAFRIGVNLGDVVEEGDNILGDGVNIAARVQGLAEAGGICITGTVYDQIKKKLNVSYTYLGEQSVKNIEDPIRTYKVRTEPQAGSPKAVEGKKPARLGLSKAMIAILGIVVIVGAAILYQFVFRPSSSKTDVASREKMAFPLPDKPSIAVLPFVNISENPKQDPVSDGMTVEIINALSKVPEVFVIDRNSTFFYKGKATNVRQVAEDLGVQYILEGSVQRFGDTVRVTAQLIDAINGHHLWSERYNRSVKDIFALQDEITMRIVTELRVKLAEGEGARVYEKGTNNLQAYLKVVEGEHYRRQENKEANAVAIRLYREALELDPNYAVAYIELSRALTRTVLLYATTSPKETLSNAMKLAQKAVELDSSSAEALAAVSLVFLTMHQPDKAIEVGERAVRLNPNSNWALDTLAMSLNASERGEEALPLLRQAIRLNPFVPIYYVQVGNSCLQTGRYEEGIAAVKKALKLAPNNLFANIFLTCLYMYARREDEARTTAAEIQRIDPDFSLERWSKVSPWKEGPVKDRQIDALRKAGLK